MLSKKLNKIPFNKKNIKIVSADTGIYVLWNKKENPIYIGKSTNLKSRLSSYLIKSLGLKTSKMVSETKYFSTIEVTSELEALLLEAKLVNGLKPLYNSQLKDDKHPLYIRITKEKYPRVTTARKMHEEEKNLAFFGPFPSSTNVRSVLKMVRRIFPYSQHKLQKRGCLYSQIGLCSPCPSEIEKVKDIAQREKLIKEYRKNIMSIKQLLSGKMKGVRKNLKDEMHKYAKRQVFEKAILSRKKIERLDYITQPTTDSAEFLKNPNLIEDIRYEELNALTNLLKNQMKLGKQIRRIECFDVAHLTGSFPTASMVTFINGKPDKTLYRHFRIRQKKGQSDTDSMREVGKRRVKYLADWGIPDLIIVDGGKAQVSVFRKIFNLHNIAVIGLAKRHEKLVIPVKKKDLSTHSFVEKSVAPGPARNLFQRVRNEAHRFARRYHHKLLQKELIPMQK